MGLVDNLKIKNKLILMLFLPLAGLIYFSINGTLEKYSEYREMGNLKLLSGIAVRISALVHELQKERGLTGGYMATRGAMFSAEVRAQRVSTDTEIERLREFIGKSNLTAFGAEFNSAMEGALNDMAMVRKKRASADALTVPENEIFAYYTKMIGAFLDTASVISTLGPNAEASIMTFGYVNFLRAKEMAAMERGFMNGVFAKGRFAPREFTRFASLVTAGDTYLKVFLSTAPERQRLFYTAMAKGRFIEESEKMRNAAFEKATAKSLGIKAAYWWEMMTGKINILKEVEDKVSRDIDEMTDRFMSSARQEFIFYITLTLAAIAVVIFLAYIITTGITHSIADLTSSSLKISTGDLDVSVERHSDDEIGVMAEAFRGMISYLKDLSTAADAIKRGDARAAVTPVSEKDVLGTAFKNMASALKERESRLRLLLKITDMELMRTGRYKADFLASMSHELKTPLTHVLGFSELLKTDGSAGLSEAGQRYVDNIYKSGRVLLKLIDNLLEFTRKGKEAGLLMKEFDPGEAMEEVVSGIRAAAEKKRHVLIVNVDREAKTMRADRAMFIEMLYNLLDNAVKFTPPEGTVDLKVWQDIDKDERILRVRVSDTGIGIKPELKDKIFSIFEVGDSTTTREYGGVGIGLALTKRFVEFHGGKIWFETKVGHGSTFEFFMPMGVEEKSRPLKSGGA